jgi:hypothetical protein
MPIWTDSQRTPSALIGGREYRQPEVQTIHFLCMFLRLIAKRRMQKPVMMA